jgi:lactoylglutathione lyase
VVDGMSVSELRLVLTAPDFEAAVRFYRDALGMAELADFSSPRGRVLLLDAGRATLELTDPDNAAYVDEMEVGRRVAGPIRVALAVPDAAAATTAATGAGATLIAEPTRTPWNSVNARLDAPAGVQLTLFSGEDLEPPT